MSNIVIISSSPRKGNSSILCDEFARGALESNHNVKRFNLRELNIKYCLGCSVCQQKGQCVIKDDVAMCLKEIENADVLVLATPIYFGEACGQLKVFMDRCYPLYPKLEGKKAVVIVSCYQNSKKHIDESLNGIKRFLRYMGNIEIVDIVYGENCDEVNDASEEKRLYAYECGKRMK